MRAHLCVTKKKKNIVRHRQDLLISCEFYIRKNHFNIWSVQNSFCCCCCLATEPLVRLKAWLLKESWTPAVALARLSRSRISRPVERGRRSFAQPLTSNNLVAFPDILPMCNHGDEPSVMSQRALRVWVETTHFQTCRTTIENLFIFFELRPGDSGIWRPTMLLRPHRYNMWQTCLF